MKTQVLLFLVVPALLLALCACSSWGHPFSDIVLDNIKEVQVKLSPPGDSFTIPEQQLPEFCGLLQTVKTKKATCSLQAATGQSVTFKIFWSDDTETVLSFHGDCSELDGASYQMEEQSREALSEFANALRKN